MTVRQSTMFRNRVLKLALAFASLYAVLKIFNFNIYVSMHSVHTRLRLVDNVTDSRSNKSCYGTMTHLRHLLHDPHDHFQPVSVNNELTYVFSAYVDDRATATDIVSSAGQWSVGVVRVFAWLLRKSVSTVKTHWRCVLWYDDQEFSNSIDTPIIGITDLNHYDFSSTIINVMILCPLNKETESSTSSSTVPVGVSIVSSRCQQPTNLVRVVDLLQRRRDRFSYDVTFTVCVPPIFGQLDDVLDIVEFLEMNALLGAEKIQLYVESTGPHVNACLSEYVARRRVQLQPWSIPSDVAAVIYYHGQILAISDCIYRHMYRTKYLLSHDLDEFVVPLTTSNWLQMLDTVNNQSKADVDKIASYNIRNRFFVPYPSSPSTTVKTQSPKDICRLKTMTNVLADTFIYPALDRSKSILRPERVLLVHVHFIEESSLVRRGDFNVFVDPVYSQLFHYRSDIPVSQMQTTKVERMTKFETVLHRRLNVASAAICLTGDFQFID